MLYIKNVGMRKGFDEAPAILDKQILEFPASESIYQAGLRIWHSHPLQPETGSQHSHVGKSVEEDNSYFKKWATHDPKPIHTRGCAHTHICVCLCVYIYIFTWANKQRLIIAIGEWHHEAYKETYKSFPAGSTSDCFKRYRISDSSDDVSNIKFRACKFERGRSSAWKPVKEMSQNKDYS